jgi:hypothetical protein
MMGSGLLSFLKKCWARIRTSIRGVCLGDWRFVQSWHSSGANDSIGEELLRGVMRRASEPERERLGP